MLSLKSRQDQWRLLFPKTFLLDGINEKYSKVLAEKKSFFQNPIDFLNESIQSIQVLGFQNATIEQQQAGLEMIQNQQGQYVSPLGRISNKVMFHQSSGFNYRSSASPIALCDKTLNINFRHTLGFVNYFMLFENFCGLYSRDIAEHNLLPVLEVEIANENGEVYCKIILENPVMDTMDMLDLNFTQPIAQSQTFQVQFKYSNFKFEFINS